MGRDILPGEDGSRVWLPRSVTFCQDSDEAGHITHEGLIAQSTFSP